MAFFFKFDFFIFEIFLFYFDLLTRKCIKSLNMQNHLNLIKYVKICNIYIFGFELKCILKRICVESHL